MTDLFYAAADIIMDIEGGLVDDPKDPGGLTNLGISQRAHPELTADQIRALTRPAAAPIYLAKYWTPSRCGELPWALAIALFDGAVQHGPVEAVTILQRASGAIEDGAFGRLTMLRINSFPARDMLARFLRERLWFYQSLGGWSRDRNGWVARLFKVASYAGAPPAT